MKKAPSKTLTDRQAAEIESLASLPDDQIDTPATSPRSWTGPRLGVASFTDR